MQYTMKIDKSTRTNSVLDMLFETHMYNIDQLLYD